MENVEIRQMAKKHGVCQWQVAEEIGVSEFTLSRWMRHELSGDRRVAVISAIKTIADRQEGK